MKEGRMAGKEERKIEKRETKKEKKRWLWFLWTGGWGGGLVCL